MADWASAVFSRNKESLGPTHSSFVAPYQSDTLIEVPSNDLDTNVPKSIPVDPDSLSLTDLPPELRLQIWNELLLANNMPRSYGYTREADGDKSKCQDESLKAPTFKKHGIVFVSKQFSSEYRQAFYEHTRFFLHINSLNAFEGLPQLAQRPRARNPAYESHVSSLPNFWNAPDKLLSSLRHCVLYIEIGEVASEPYAAHSVSRLVRANSSLPEARRVRMEMKTYSSHAAIKEQDTEFDVTLITALQRLIQHMVQLRSMQLVWNLDVVCPRTRSERFTTSLHTDWSFKTLGEPYVDTLQAKRMVSKFEVKVGDKFDDTIVRGVRGEGGKWTVIR